MNKRFVFSIAGMFLLLVAGAGWIPHQRDIQSAQSAAAVLALATTQKDATKANSESLSTQIAHLSALMLAPATGPVPGAPSQGDADLRVEWARQRGELMQQLAKTDPKAFLLNVIPETSWAKLPAAAQAAVERRTQIRGIVVVLHIDDFSNPRNSRFEYHLHSGNRQLNLHFAGNSPALLSGTTVEIDGYQIGESVIATGDTGGLTIVAAPSPTPESVGLQNTLAILITAPGQPAHPTKDQMEALIFNNQFQQFYEEQSYGKVRFTGHVTDWISVPNDLTTACGSGIGLEATPAIRSYIIENGIDLAAYNRIVYIVNTGPSGGGCANTGPFDYTFNSKTYHASFATVGYSDSAWDRNGMTGFQYVLAHEMGHALGVKHANSWDCSGVSLENNCWHNEYGNDYDVMGSGRYAAHFNAFYKDYLGWFDTADKVDIRSTGVYSLAPIESASGTRAGVINNPALVALDPLAQPTYLEYRQPIGFDRLLPERGIGLHINQVIYSGVFDPFTRIINANHSSAPTDHYKVLEDGSTFTWSARGITLGPSATASSTEETATFRVSLFQPVCVRAAPTLQIGLPQSISTGSWAGIGFDVTNNDATSCPARSFTYSALISDSSDWSKSVYPTDPVLLEPKSQSIGSVSVLAPSDAVIGDHTLSIIIADSTTGQTYTFTYSLRIAEPAVIDSILPASGYAGTIVSLRGSGFDVEPLTNSVSLYSQTHYADISVTTAASSSLIFAVPNTVHESNDGKGVLSFALVPLPEGNYSIRVSRSSGGYSNEVPFVVDAKPLVDTKPPTVSLTSPASGSTVSGTVNFTATALDDVGVTKVELHLGNGKLLGTDTTAPYSFAWNSASLPDAKRSFAAVAHDAAGNIATSSFITLTVDNVKLSAAPNPCAPATGKVNCTTNLVRTVPSGVTTQLWVTKDTNAPGNVACKGGSATTTVGWITPGHTYVFNLYQTASCTSSISGLTPVATVTVTGIAAPLFLPGDRVQATAKLNIRALPSATSTLVGTLAANSLGTVLAGPTVSGTTKWWNIKWDSGLSGWSAQGYLKKVASSTASAPIRHTLAKTWTGPEVRALQSVLTTLGYYSDEVTGYFGTITEAAVRELQAANNLAAVGIVGPKTRAILSGLGL